MNSVLNNWFNQPTKVKLLDLSLIGYLLIIILGLGINLLFLDFVIQNILVLLITVALFIFTNHLKSQMLLEKNSERIRRNVIEWFLVSSILIITILVIIIVYPITI